MWVNSLRRDKVKGLKRRDQIKYTLFLKVFYNSLLARLLCMKLFCTFNLVIFKIRQRLSLICVYVYIFSLQKLGNRTPSCGYNLRSNLRELLNFVKWFCLLIDVHARATHKKRQKFWRKLKKKTPHTKIKDGFLWRSPTSYVYITHLLHVTEQKKYVYFCKMIIELVNRIEVGPCVGFSFYPIDDEYDYKQLTFHLLFIEITFKYTWKSTRKSKVDTVSTRLKPYCH